MSSVTAIITYQSPGNKKPYRNMICPILSPISKVKEDLLQLNLKSNLLSEISDEIG